MKHKVLVYQVSVGPTSKLYSACIKSVRRWCKLHGYDHHIQSFPKLSIKPDPFRSNRSEGALRLGYLPIYEKENAFEFLTSYDYVLIIDADVYIRDKADSPVPQLHASGDAIGLVAEREMALKPHYVDKIVNYSRMQYSSLNDVDWKWNDRGAEFFNMGVMVLSNRLLPYLKGQTPKQFLERPEFDRFINGQGAWKWSTDQTLLNWWVKKENIPVLHLDEKWNCLYTAQKDRLFEKGSFLHFFLKDKLPSKGEDVEQLFAAAGIEEPQL